MAFNGSHGIFLSLALLLAIMAATPYVGKGDIVVSIAAMRVTGNLYCTLTGNPSPIGISPPLVNANVSITCPNITTVVARTDTSGFFNATLVTLPGAYLGLNLTNSSLITGCQVSVQLPVRSCQVLPVTGALGGALMPVGLSVDNFLNGPLSTVGGHVNSVGGLVINVLAFAFGLLSSL